MVKKDSDDLLSAISKHFKNNSNTTIRLTLKRGGLWKQQYAKAHSRKAKNLIRQSVKKQFNDQTTYPLIARVKTNQGRFNIQNKINKGCNFIQSAFNIFRVNFFKLRAEKQQKPKNQATKPKPDSKSTKKKIQKKRRNKQRNQKRKSIQVRLRRQKKTEKK